jgi:hypothetical protein
LAKEEVNRGGATENRPALQRWDVVPIRYQFARDDRTLLPRLPSLTPIQVLE